MSYIDRLDDQIATISRLVRNWDSYGAPAIDQAALAWLAEVREACARGDIKRRLFFYPSSNGGAHVEFDDGPYCVSATFDPKTGLTDFAATCVRPPTVEDIEGTISTVAELGELIRRVCQSATDSATGDSGAKNGTLTPVDGSRQTGAPDT